MQKIYHVTRIKSEDGFMNGTMNGPKEIVENKEIPNKNEILQMRYKIVFAMKFSLQMNMDYKTGKKKCNSSRKYI